MHASTTIHMSQVHLQPLLAVPTLVVFLVLVLTVSWGHSTLQPHTHDWENHRPSRKHGIEPRHGRRSPSSYFRRSTGRTLPVERVARLMYPLRKEWRKDLRTDPKLLREMVSNVTCNSNSRCSSGTHDDPHSSSVHRSAQNACSTQCRLKATLLWLRNFE